MGGQKIADQSFWGGGKSKASVFPEGVKCKDMSSAEGAGGITHYEDTTEAVKAQQMLNKKKVLAYPPKQYYRN